MRKLPHLKSTLMAYRSCPAFMEAIFLKGMGGPPGEPAIVGTDFHSFARDFFPRVKPIFRKALKLSKLEDLKLLFRELMENDIKTEMGMLEANFCDFEAEHLWKLKHVIPGREKKFFFPIDRELYVEIKTGDFTLDRVDLLTSSNACVFEYKTGTHWNKTLLRCELAVYVTGLKSVKKYREKYPPTHIACYNPRLQKFLFEKLHRKTVISMLGWMDEMFEAINKGTFRRKYSGLCHFCPRSEKCYDELPEAYKPINMRGGE